ncbi:hypothetical protein XENTR_v10002947 [Xenopus tropicalis]|uniref:Heat shock protein beta-3 n=1 Tax=Xenopus tropicalis TaxID=8364 RepID=A0A8J0QWZ6_XENTR|nr:heat shock protein beta-3 [Xenopus tropicalis]KAE8636345.1 hypothetical protein XENTR_v10002947 [Xenopus tropicalis]|eukprot:XP_002941074.1 PREDICTED: heat shock protein beta-3 [Xenopus tropicalis]
MQQVSIRHWIETPVRYKEMLATRDLQDCSLHHMLFALPGPQCSDHKKREDGQLDDQQEEDDKFKVLLDVVQFRPEDIIIQVFEGWLIIKGEHGCRMDEHGFISRSFTRTYQLPNGIGLTDLSAFFCHDGILAVEGKQKQGLALKG